MSAFRGLLMVTLMAAILAPVQAQQQTEFAEIMAQQQMQDHVQAWGRYAYIASRRRRQRPSWMAKSGCASGAARRRSRTHSDDHAPPSPTWSSSSSATPLILYVSFRIERPESAASPSGSDFFEMLLHPGHAHDRYNNIAGGLDGVLWHGIGPNLDRSAWVPEVEYAARTTWFGWEGEMAIPFAEFGRDGPPEAGTIWGLDLVRNERTPTDRLAHFAWRSTWAATKDLAHAVFLGQPLASRVEEIG